MTKLNKFGHRGKDKVMLMSKIKFNVTSARCCWRICEWHQSAGECEIMPMDDKGTRVTQLLAGSISLPNHDGRTNV